MHSSHLVLHCQPPNSAQQSPLQNDCNTVNCLHSGIVSGRVCQVQVTEPCEIPTVSPESKYRQFISKLLHPLKGNVSLLLIKLLLSMLSSFSWHKSASNGGLLHCRNNLNPKGYYKDISQGLMGLTLSFWHKCWLDGWRQKKCL